MISCDKCGFGHKTFKEMDACKSWAQIQAEKREQVRKESVCTCDRTGWPGSASPELHEVNCPDRKGWAKVVSDKTLDQHCQLCFEKPVRYVKTKGGFWKLCDRCRDIIEIAGLAVPNEIIRAQ